MLINMLIKKLINSYPQYKYVHIFTLLTWYNSIILAKNRVKKIRYKEKWNKLSTKQSTGVDKYVVK